MFAGSNKAAHTVSPFTAVPSYLHCQWGCIHCRRFEDLCQQAYVSRNIREEAEMVITQRRRCLRLLCFHPTYVVRHRVGGGAYISAVLVLRNFSCLQVATHSADGVSNGLRGTENMAVMLLSVRN